MTLFRCLPPLFGLAFACAVAPAHADIFEVASADDVHYTAGATNTFTVDVWLSSPTTESANDITFTVSAGLAITGSTDIDGQDTCFNTGVELRGLGTVSAGWFATMPQDYCGPYYAGAGVPVSPAASHRFTVDVDIPAGYTGDLPVLVTADGYGGGPDPHTASHTIIFNTTGTQAPPVAASNFDDAAPPYLPTGWTSTQAGAGAGWITSYYYANSAPYSAFAEETATTGESVLIGPPVVIDAGGAVLGFRQRFTTEPFDGGILEIATDGGNFTDIVAAGGTFIAGGYNATLASDATCGSDQNPLAGHPAWSGAQADFVTTSVLLPAAASGHSIQLRWRFGTDCEATAVGDLAGWWIDTITLTAPNAQPAIAHLTPVDFSFALAANASGTQALSIANNGGDALDFTVVAAGASGSAAGPAQSHGATGATDAFQWRAGHSNAPHMRGRIIEGNDTSIAQTGDSTVADTGGIACAGGTSTGQNSWWRRFSFGDYPQVGSVVGITGVTVGSEAGPALPVVINLYTTPHGVTVDTIDVGQLTLIGTGYGRFGGALQVATIPVTATVDDAIGKDLIVEYHVESSEAGAFYPGSTTSAQTHPTFMSSFNCAIPVPTNAATLGWPDFHLVMSVQLGDPQPLGDCATPASVPWLQVASASGSVAAGQSQSVAVTANASGLGQGDYLAKLCVASNDPSQPLQQIPVHLAVDGGGVPPADHLFCNGFDDGTSSGCGGASVEHGMYNTRDGFLAHVAAGFAENGFDEIGAGPSPPLVYTAGEFAYSIASTTTHPDSALFNGVGTLSTDYSSDSLVITFSGAPVTAIGGNAWGDANIPTGSSETLKFTLSDGTVVTYPTVGVPTAFFGFTTTQPITQITIDAPDGGNPNSGPFFWPHLDNLIIGARQ